MVDDIKDVILGRGLRIDPDQSAITGSKDAIAPGFVFCDSKIGELDRGIVNFETANVVCLCDGTVRAITQCLVNAEAVDAFVWSGLERPDVSMVTKTMNICAKKGMARLIQIAKKPTQEPENDQPKAGV